MSNRNPNTSGLERRWKPGEDDRVDLRDGCGVPRSHVDAVIDALQDLLLSRRRVKIVGFGSFEWKPWNNRLPTGARASSWRLVFRPSKYARRYNGDT